MATRKQPAVASPALKPSTLVTEKTIPLNVSVGESLHDALIAYAKFKGLQYPQDVLRVAGTIMMRKEGFLI